LEDGTLANFITADIGYMRRQDLPPAYVINGAIYLNKCDVLLNQRTFLPPGALPYIMPPERSMDIDTSWDFYLADLILRNRRDDEN
jgi:CMP-N-acetylneuraminic acid synthetase